MQLKTKSTYICGECGYQTAKWMGKCPSCGEWNTLTETIIESKKETAAKTRSVYAKKPSKINDISTDSESRIMTGLSELDRVLGGGLVKGSLILVGGDPGIGKSTLLLQLCQTSGQKILYVSGEESERQIKKFSLFS